MTAWIALSLWPLVGIVLFRTLSPAAALSVTLIGGYLLLPHGTNYDLQGLPPIDKDTVPAATAALMVLMLGRRDDVLAGWLPRDWVTLVCLAFLVFGGFGTALTNTDALGGAVPRQGMRLYDGFNLALSSVMTVLPFLMARKLLSTGPAQDRFLTIFVAAACGYVVLALYEIRMSPQLHVMVYGYFQDSWGQHVRGDGFRPIVFLRHALWLAILLATAAVIAAGLFRTGRLVFLLAVFWLLGTLYLSKSLGSSVTATLFVPAALFLRQQTRLIIAAAVAGVVLLYPMLRAADLIPTDSVIAAAAKVSAERAGSFDLRVRSEDTLLARAYERPVFGWGGYGRERAYDDNGNELSISDGFWVITVGQGGWVRYLGTFGLLAWPVLALAFARRRAPPAAAVLALALAVNLIDLIPNAGVVSLTWMMAGALAGLLERMRAGDVADATAAAAAGRIRPVLRRDLSPPVRRRPEQGGHRTK